MKRTDTDKAVLILVACLSVAVLIFGGGIIIDIGGALAEPTYLDLR